MHDLFKCPISNSSAFLDLDRNLIIQSASAEAISLLNSSLIGSCVGSLFPKVKDSSKLVIFPFKSLQLYACIHRKKDSSAVCFVQNISLLASMYAKISLDGIESITHGIFTKHSRSYSEPVHKKPKAKTSRIRDSYQRVGVLTELVLVRAEQQIISLAGIVGLSVVPKWLFNQIRGFSTNAINMLQLQKAITPSSSNDDLSISSLAEFIDNGTMIISLNLYGTIQQIYPLEFYKYCESGSCLMQYIHENDVSELVNCVHDSERLGSSTVTLNWVNSTDCPFKIAKCTILLMRDRYEHYDGGGSGQLYPVFACIFSRVDVEEPEDQLILKNDYGIYRAITTSITEIKKYIRGWSNGSERTGVVWLASSVTEWIYGQFSK